MLSAGIFHGKVLSSRGSGVYELRPQSGEAMNDAKCKRGLTVPSASITLVTTSAFTTKGGQVQASKCYRIPFALCYPALLFCCLALQPTSLSSVQKEVRQAGISRLCMLTKLFVLPACSAYLPHPHVLRSQPFVYPSLTLGQQNGHFLCICVFVCLCVYSWQQFLSFLWWSHSVVCLMLCGRKSHHHL